MRQENVLTVGLSETKTSFRLTRRRLKRDICAESVVRPYAKTSGFVLSAVREYSRM